MVNLLTHSMRYEIIKPINVSWDELGNALRDLSYTSTKMCNMAVQHYWEWERKSVDHKKITGKFPKDKEILGTSIQNFVYRKLVEEFSEVSSTVVTQTNDIVYKKWKKDLRDIRLFKKSVPSYKEYAPIYISNQNWSLDGYTSEDNGKEYHINFTLYSRNSNREVKRFTVLINKGETSKEAILQSLIDGAYGKGFMQIVCSRKRQKRKWFCVISYKHNDCPNYEFVPNRVMGIDMGRVFAVCWAFNDSPKRGYIQGGEIESFRKRVEARRRSMLRIAGQPGHGRKRKMQATEVLHGKIVAFRDTINHKYSRRIVEAAIKNQCGQINMEDLTGITRDNFFLKDWTYFDLQNKIKYKAEQYGINVRMVAAAYTSQTCSKCGHIDRENRPTQDKFICQQCGYEENADYNAARNISMSSKYIDGK